MDPRKNAKSDKKTSVWTVVIAIAVFLLPALGELDADAVAGVIVLVIFALPVVILVLVAKRTKKLKSAQHSHDRIDHSRDLQINPTTGRVEQKPMQNSRHTPQEHWKQQLDGLLANGTIDREEYRALMNRKF